MPPGAKLSEVEVARRIGVSRQPVREAFNRLATMDLLLIRPQKSTRVRGFSMDDTVNGEWTLHVQDLAGRDIGFIEGWALELTSRMD